ncbi:MAG: hypothetical protein QOI73_2267 [Solirubrobacteraceae bacterium]|nr:hypothetical protein [Solirubrobacteraceae bacterium]
MLRRWAIPLLAVVCVLAAPRGASGGLRERIAAANKVEHKLTFKHPRYRWVAACDQRSSTRFDCTFVGRRGTHAGRGRARVTRSGQLYVVKLGFIAYS